MNINKQQLRYALKLVISEYGLIGNHSHQLDKVWEILKILAEDLEE